MLVKAEGLTALVKYSSVSRLQASPSPPPGQVNRDMEGQTSPAFSIPFSENIKKRKEKKTSFKLLCDDFFV